MTHHWHIFSFKPFSIQIPLCVCVLVGTSIHGVLIWYLMVWSYHPPNYKIRKYYPKVSPLIVQYRRSLDICTCIIRAVLLFWIKLIYQAYLAPFPRGFFSIRKSKDYVYGIWVYKALDIYLMIWTGASDVNWRDMAKTNLQQTITKHNKAGTACPTLGKCFSIQDDKSFRAIQSAGFSYSWFIQHDNFLLSLLLPVAAVLLLYLL